jgi:hypothetical protein
MIKTYHYYNPRQKKVYESIGHLWRINYNGVPAWGFYVEYSSLQFLTWSLIL